MIVPLNFEQTQPGHNNTTKNIVKLGNIKSNPQTKLFCQKLEIDDPVELILKTQPNPSPNTDDSIEITTQSFIDDSDILEDLNDSIPENIPVNKSLKLNLPIPKNLDEFDVNDVNENMTETESTQCDLNVPDENREKNEYNDTPMKKFKRRNADMYTTVE